MIFLWFVNLFQVKEYCQPFLRCCVLFFHFLTTVPAREELNSHGGDTFENMCLYLGLNGNWRELIFNDTMQALAKHWTNHPRIHELMKQRESKVNSFFVHCIIVAELLYFSIGQLFFSTSVLNKKNLPLVFFLIKCFGLKP